MFQTNDLEWVSDSCNLRPSRLYTAAFCSLFYSLAKGQTAWELAVVKPPQWTTSGPWGIVGLHKTSSLPHGDDPFLRKRPQVLCSGLQNLASSTEIPLVFSQPVVSPNENTCTNCELWGGGEEYLSFSLSSHRPSCAAGGIRSDHRQRVRIRTHTATLPGKSHRCQVRQQVSNSGRALRGPAVWMAMLQ